MKKIIDYKIVSLLLEKKGLFDRLTEEDFEQKINDYISCGYQPYGKLKVLYEDSPGVFKKNTLKRLVQVMVKHESN